MPPGDAAEAPVDKSSAAVAGGWRGRLLRRIPGPTRIGSFVDQGFQGVGNIAASAFLGRGLDHTQFATIGVMIGVHYFAWGFHRSCVILPMILNASEAGAKSEDEDAWWWINLISVVIVAAVLGLAAVVYGMIDPAPGHRWMVDAVALAALVSPPLCAIEFGRRRLYQHGRGVTAALASAISSTVLIGVAVWDATGPRSPLLGALAWTFGGLAGTAAAFLAAPPRRLAWAKIARVWRDHRHFAFWQTMTAIPYAFYTTITVVLVAAFGGAAAAAAFTASRTLINPALAVVSAIDTLDKPRAARALFNDGLSGLYRSIRTTLLTVIGLTGPYLLVLTVFAGPILDLVFGSKFHGYGLGVSILALSAFFMCLNQAPETALIVLRAGEAMTAVRLGAAIFTVVGIWLGARYFGFVGCAGALLATNVINFSVLRITAGVVGRGWVAR